MHDVCINTNLQIKMIPAHRSNQFYVKTLISTCVEYVGVWSGSFIGAKLQRKFLTNGYIAMRVGQGWWKCSKVIQCNDNKRIPLNGLKINTSPVFP